MSAIDEEDYLVRTRSLIEHAIRRRWAEGLITKDADGVFTAYLGANEVERLMKTEAPREREIGDHAYAADAPLGVLARRLDLRPSEVDLLAVLLACESDPRAARLVTYLGGNQAPLALTFELLLEIVYRARFLRQSDAAAAVFRDLAPSRPLRRLRYITIDGADKRVALAQGVRLEGRVASWLLGSPEPDPELTPFLRIHAPSEPPPTEVVGALVDPAVAAFRSGRRLLDIQGPRQSGREFVLRHAAAAVGRSLLVVSGRGLGVERVVLAFREASLSGALLAFTDGDDVLAGDGILSFRNCLPAYDDTVALIGCRESVPRLAAMRPTTTVQVAVPPFEARVELWSRHLGADTGLSQTDLHQVAATYNLGVSGILNDAMHQQMQLQAGNLGLDVGEGFAEFLSEIVLANYGVGVQPVAAYRTQYEFVRYLAEVFGKDTIIRCALADGDRAIKPEFLKYAKDASPTWELFLDYVRGARYPDAKELLVDNLVPMREFLREQDEEAERQNDQFWAEADELEQTQREEREQTAWPAESVEPIPSRIAAIGRRGVFATLTLPRGGRHGVREGWWMEFGSDSDFFPERYVVAEVHSHSCAVFVTKPYEEVEDMGGQLVTLLKS